MSHLKLEHCVCDGQSTQKSKNKTPLAFRSAFLPITLLQVTPSLPTQALKFPRRTMESPSENYRGELLGIQQRACEYPQTCLKPLFFRSLVPEPTLCVELSPTISSWYHSTSHISSGFSPASEVTFYVPRASLHRRVSAHPGPHLRLPPSSYCTRPQISSS